MSITANSSAASDDIRALRRAAGLTQQETAARAGCSVAAIALFESGYRPTRSDVLPRVLAALDQAERQA